jgi:adenylate cyclase
MLKRFLLMGLIPLIAIGVFSLLERYSLLAPVENRVYDLALGFRPPVSEDPSLLFVDVDDEAIEKSATLWPWPRDYMANGLLLMKEFGADRAVLDILYEQPSPPGINLSKYSGVGEAYRDVFNGLKSNFVALAQAIADGSLPAGELAPVVEMYLGDMDNAEKSLLDRVNEITQDRDEFLGKAARAFGNGFFSVNSPVDDRSRSAGTAPDLLVKAFTRNAAIEGRLDVVAPDIILPIAPVLKGAKALGFVKINRDLDGVTRRIDLFYEFKEKAIPQLGLVALLDLLGNPAVEIKNDGVILKGAVRPGSGIQTDIGIPLTEAGTMLINWPKKPFIDSFRHISFWWLLQHDRTEEAIISNVSLLAGWESEGKINVRSGPLNFLEKYYNPLVKMKQDFLNEKAVVSIDAYRKLREEFVARLDELFSPAKEEELVKSVQQNVNLKTDEKESLIAVIRKAYKANKEGNIPFFKDVRNKLKTDLAGAFCFTSWTATSTTDNGVTPFQGNYANVGMHASVVNTILQGRFLDDSPWWLAVILTALGTLAIYLLVFGIKSPVVSVLAGAGMLIIIGGGIGLFFILTGTYLHFIAPFASAFIVFIIFTIINFLRTAKEKTFIRHAFSHYLSKEVISELIADPSKLNLGGELKRLTALFTDIKGFSGLSELLEAPELVRLLNGYLTDMSNIILELNGTIDKFIGDAIVSFFGAPVNLPRHAHNACLAAVRMKKVEHLMNEHIVAEKLSPKPLLTRIGVNTGDMVVGNMGTESSFNYTIMGHHVNLAARLEGVNKQYGTWILISEGTYNDGGSAFLTRKLDRVRVVGIGTPVRIYELIDEKSTARPELFEVIDIFHQGLEAFELREWEKARGLFKQALKLQPDDGPSEAFLKRAQAYIKEPPPANWDGVFSLTTK